MTENVWLHSYPPGVRWDASLAIASVPSILTESAQQWPDHPAINFMGGRLTYRELDALVDRAAVGLQRLGVAPGVHVGLFLPNTPHYLIAFMGVLRAGGTVVNYSPLDAAKVLEHKIADSETDILITLDLALLYPQMRAMLGKTRLRMLVVGDVAEFAAAPKAVRAHLAAEKQLAEVAADSQHLTFAALLDNDGKHKAFPVENPAETVAVLQYTGGTTGQPKGAMLTHANLTAAACQALETTQTKPPLVRLGEERILAVLPPFHIYALTLNLLALKVGGELYLHIRFDADAVVRELEARKITVFPGVPTMFVAVLHNPLAKSADLSSLRWCMSGGAPLPVEVQRAFEQLTGCRLAEGWGMTETSPTGTFTPVPGKIKPGSCGIPSPGIRFKFASVETPGVFVPQGERGEMCIKGPNVMKGYWKNQQATDAVMTEDGYMRTGDVAYMDEDGYIFIVDRTKDMILCGGFNVYPRTIEEAIYQHPAVEEVIVIGIPDAYRGQSPKAFVTLKQDAADVTLEEMKTFLRDRLGKHEMISALEVRAALPKTPVGKLSKKELYEEEARKAG